MFELLVRSQPEANQSGARFISETSSGSQRDTTSQLHYSFHGSYCFGQPRVLLTLHCRTSCTSYIVVESQLVVSEVERKTHVPIFSIS